LVNEKNIVKHLFMASNSNNTNVNKKQHSKIFKEKVAHITYLTCNFRCAKERIIEISNGFMSFIFCSIPYKRELPTLTISELKSKSKPNRTVTISIFIRIQQFEERKSSILLGTHELDVSDYSFLRKEFP